MSDNARGGGPAPRRDPADIHWDDLAINTSDPAYGGAPVGVARKFGRAVLDSRACSMIAVAVTASLLAIATWIQVSSGGWVAVGTVIIDVGAALIALVITWSARRGRTTAAKPEGSGAR